MSKKIVIIGAGPTGLGAGYRLNELGYENWLIFEKENHVGGLSSSYKDDIGFTWDVGVHVIHSHYKYFDELFFKLMKDEYLLHDRSTWIWFYDRFIPYPFQNNIRYLPFYLMLESLYGAAVANLLKPKKPLNFKEWILNIFGKGIARQFMLPYNQKLWTIDPENMDYNWIGERVSVVDFRRMLFNVLFFKNDIAWGPNNKFWFPKKGGTGELFNRFADNFGEHLKTNKKVKNINQIDKLLYFEDGSIEKYDVLINTIPIDGLVNMLHTPEKEVLAAAADLKHNSCYIVGIGLKKPIKWGKSWAYFPDPNISFYRVTYFSDYSPYNVPDAKNDAYSSIMCEISYTAETKKTKEEILDVAISDLVKARVINEKDLNQIVDKFYLEVPYAYPIPTIGRNKSLEIINEYLEKHSIFSRGRFGAWKYEVGNMDHCVMQGKDVVDKLLNLKQGGDMGDAKG